jgi:peroxidase
MQAGGEYYAVPTGRRDSRVSLASSVNLPGPGFSVASAASAFQGRGLNITDMVTLLGAHTTGVAHCEFFYNRLYNFSGTGRNDPSMAPALVESLKSVCPQGSTGLGQTVALDQGTEFSFDNSYYKQLEKNRGILQIDQELTYDHKTSRIVKSLAGRGSRFGTSFGEAMVKMGNIGVLTGSQGEIRRIWIKSTREGNLRSTVKQPAWIQDAVVEPNSKHSFVAVDMIFWAKRPNTAIS